MSNKNPVRGMNILVCGSQRFEDASFVFNTLENFYILSKGNVRTLYTSRFSGACQYAQIWANNKNEMLGPDQQIKVQEYTLDKLLVKKNQSLYEQMDVPEYILQTDNFYQEGKELLLARGINLVMAFPNADGILGASTRNIQRFAQLAEIKSFDCSEILGKMHEFKTQSETSSIVTEEKTIIEPRGLGFNNRHPNKR